MKTACDLAIIFSRALTSGMMDFQRLTNISFQLIQCEQVPGCIVEFGCNKGKTAALMASISAKQIWLYDSFKGLPSKSSLDITRQELTEGSMRCDRTECEETFKLAGIEPPPTIIEKWFDRIHPNDLPARISFAHLDGDFYRSIKISLELVYPRMSAGAVCVIDDYSWPGLPGVKFATDEFMEGKPETLVHPMMLGYRDRAHQCWFVKL
jgi:O-methyltransferase